MQLCQQAESMRVMNNTTNYDYGQIKMKMDTTYSHRQQLVREMKPIKDIVELYVGLSITSLVNTCECIAFDSRIVWCEHTEFE
jgi:hypothetical protein